MPLLITDLPMTRLSIQLSMNIEQANYLQQLNMDAHAFSIEALLFVLTLGVYVLGSGLIERHNIHYIHESTIAIFMGFLTALFAKYALDKQIAFSNGLFFALVLPPIVFAVGYGTRKSLFFHNFGKITFLGIFGSLLGFILLACVLNLINNYLFNFLTSSQILLICSVFCSTDPTTSTAAIKVDKHPMLNAIVTGEGILNSAVAIILFGTIQKLSTDGDFSSWETMLQILLNFSYLFFFSLALGMVFGLVLSYIFKKVDSFSNFPIKETSLILLNGYFSYLTGELLGLSGIISLFTSSIIFAHYGFNNLSEESKRGTGLAFETVRYIAQAFVFTYLGASLIAVNGQWSAVGMGILIVLLLPLIRCLMIFPLPLLFKICRVEFPLSLCDLKMLWYSGLVRGVIAFALCLQIGSDNFRFIVTVALVVVMVTTFLGATFIKPFALKIGFQNQDFDLMRINGENLQDAEEKNKQFMPASKYGVIGREDTLDGGEGEENRHFKSFEQKFIKPIFMRSERGHSNLQMVSMDRKNKKIEIIPSE